MNKKSIYYAALLITFVNMGALGTVLYYRFVEGNKSTLIEHRNEQFEEMKQALQLSASQISQLQVCRTNFYGRMDALSAVLLRERKELANELWRMPLDSSRIDGLVDSVGQVQSAAQRAIISHLFEVRNVLTPKQQVKLQTIVLQRFASRQPLSPQH